MPFFLSCFSALFPPLSHPFYLAIPTTLNTKTNSPPRGINEGRQAAREVDLYLEQCTNLPVTGGIVKRSAEEVFAAEASAAKGVAEAVAVAA